MSKHAFSGVICRDDTRKVHGPLDRGINWMSPLQGRSPLVQVKEPYGNLDMVNYLYAFILQPGVYKVHLPIILAGVGSGSI